MHWVGEEGRERLQFALSVVGVEYLRMMNVRRWSKDWRTFVTALRQNKDLRFQVSGPATDKLLEYLKGKLTGAQQGNSMRTIREISRQSEERVGHEEGEARDGAQGMEMEGGEPEVGQRRRPEQEARSGGVQGEAEEGDPLRGRRGESGAGEEVTDTEP